MPEQPWRDPIPSILHLTKSNGWLAVDCSTGEFIDPHDPSYEGWEGFKDLVDRFAGEKDSHGQ